VKDDVGQFWKFKFEIRNSKLDQLQGLSAKMAANGIRTHARTNQ